VRELAASMQLTKRPWSWEAGVYIIGLNCDRMQIKIKIKILH